MHYVKSIKCKGKRMEMEKITDESEGRDRDSINLI